jgi:hypothetical protein
LTLQQSCSVGWVQVAFALQADELDEQQAVAQVVFPHTTWVPLHEGGLAIGSKRPGEGPLDGLLHLELLGHWPPTAWSTQHVWVLGAHEIFEHAPLQQPSSEAHAPAAEQTSCPFVAQ